MNIVCDAGGESGPTTFTRIHTRTAEQSGTQTIRSRRKMVKVTCVRVSRLGVCVCSTEIRNAKPDFCHWKGLALNAQQKKCLKDHNISVWLKAKDDRRAFCAITGTYYNRSRQEQCLRQRYSHLVKHRPPTPQAEIGPDWTMKTLPKYNGVSNQLSRCQLRPRDTTRAALHQW